MLYQISYHFNSRDDPDEEFFKLLDGLGTYQLGFDGFILIDAAYTARGIREELDSYFLGGRRGKYFIGRTVRDCGGRLSRKNKEFISKRWGRIPAIGDLGELPKR